ncbi:unnamed protein product [Schistosoma mattheei]|uniref:Uncharacterized protein n=1 Tax=Schistosoma mattheei TaxID=31246 RepID=A0A183PDQ6_9TREM|nr:unnamed protein product [Schistosoma mattheei]
MDNNQSNIRSTEQAASQFWRDSNSSHLFEEGVKSHEMNVENTENDIQMLNLLSRIFTFCIREFTKEILTPDINSQAVVAFMGWLSWTINVSYAGGLYPLGSKFPVRIGEEINNSFFLSIDIILSHMITLHPPSESQEDCSIFVQAISHSGTTDEKYPCSGEFYTTLLQQICASVCGLSMVCFPYLVSWITCTGYRLFVCVSSTKQIYIPFLTFYFE